LRRNTILSLAAITLWLLHATGCNCLGLHWPVPQQDDAQATDYHHSLFHPVPTHPVFLPDGGDQFCAGLRPADRSSAAEHSSQPGTAPTRLEVPTAPLPGGTPSRTEKPEGRITATDGGNRSPAEPQSWIFLPTTVRPATTITDAPVVARKEGDAAVLR
jgi:hypothetical protein